MLTDGTAFISIVTVSYYIESNVRITHYDFLEGILDKIDCHCNVIWGTYVTPAQSDDVLTTDDTYMLLDVERKGGLLSLNQSKIIPIEWAQDEKDNVL